MGESIEGLAGEHKSKGRTLTDSERDERNHKLIQDRLRRTSWKRLAVKYDLSERQSQAIYAAWRETHKPTYEGRDPIDMVHGMLETYEAWIEQLAEIAESASQDTARIGAVNSQMTAMRQIADLCQATGLLPKNLGTLRLELDVRVLSKKLVQVFNEHGATPELKRAVLEVLSPDAVQVAGLPPGSD